MYTQNISINGSNNEINVINGGQGSGLLKPEQAETAEERRARLKAACELTDESTYEQLRAASLPTYMKCMENGCLTGVTVPIKAPRAECLEKSGAKVLVSGKSGEIEIIVFDNGFFIATDTSDPDQHRTVDGVERVISNLRSTRLQRRRMVWWLKRHRNMDGRRRAWQPKLRSSSSHLILKR